MTCQYGKKYTIPQAHMSYGDKFFKWWNTEPDGSGVDFKPGDSISNLTTKNGDKIVLYAQWSPLFDVEDGNEMCAGYYDRDGNLKTALEVNKWSWEWKYYSYKNNYTLIIYPEITKVYNSPSARSGEYIKCKFVVRNSRGIVVETQSFIQNNMYEGQMCVGKIYLFDVQPDIYYLEVYDY
jgi:hypothetical protein